MYIWCICIYIYIIYIHHYTYIYIWYPIIISICWASSPIIHRQEPDSEGFLQKDPMKPQIQRLFEAQQTALWVPKKRVQKAQETAGNQWKPWIYSMDMETSWCFFHDFSIVGRWTSAAASSELWHANPATQSLKQKHTSWKTHIYIYIHRCIYIHKKMYIYISVPNISISISGKTSTFFSWQRRPPTWTTSWRSCWIHGFRRRRACWMIGTLKNGEETMGLYHG